MATVRLSTLKKVFGTNAPAVDVDELKIENGEFLTLLGPSGCGKSTLLRMLAGLETPTSGRIMFDERIVNELDPAERNIAMVFQNYALYPHMTVAENVGYPLKKRGVPKDERTARIAEIAALLKIDMLLDRKPRQLSGGQQQRVALGRAMIRNPAVYLFDEPLSNLDAALRSYMRNELIRLHAKLRGTMVFVTHDQVEAMTMSTRIAVMEAGCIQQLATPDEIYERPATKFVAGFVGTPAMNFIEAEVVPDGATARIKAGDFTLDVTQPDGMTAPLQGPLTLGIRPEHILLGQGTDKAEITVVESLGNEQIITIDTGRRELVLRSTSGEKHRIGEHVTYALRPDRLHFFAADTGRRIGPN
ncbi:sn-glycerol-3-phosphate import ATP-binding protein UgpC [Agaricicola taiwanensis]|uniref:sn-glycerol-3-phosphate import ATP-binding protein UgpC n=1 Tax=Agaricicola taiwanensis TaxID=591372 RepID=A0A8J2VZE1_9RHOB|nr:sn-glycerol-3-phosphate ABC transporter ATP-binding protein UgpC [Agaricicola taiwanensis]GGE41183.1 sn-glycerol-3-phosphate import ATP-binding protein UgpC [Agaricicola taiwanensis]